VDRLFSSSAFVDFGPDRLDATGQPRLVQQVSGPRVSSLRTHLRETCPRKPGVYGMVDEHGELIYIGKAKSLRARLLSYFRPRSRDAKAGRILAHTRTIAWELSPCEFGALHRELDLIRRWRPRFNVQGQPHGRQFTYVCVGRAPAPYVFVARRPPRKILASFGPVPAGRRAGEAVRRVNDWFQLRDCPQAQEMVFAEQAELFPTLSAAGCLRHEIGTCLGPCIGACSQRAYGVRVRQARAFLGGTDQTPLQLLERDMTAAAALQAYERAALLRDKLESLGWLHEQLERMRQAQSHGAFIYPVAGHDGAHFWYLIQGGRTVAAVTAPTSPESGRATAERLTAVYQEKQLGEGVPLFEHFDGMLLVAAWFRKYPEERAATLTPADALAACRLTVKV
jgi:excinuclease ABC subunit C